jgi:hypothetical protein
MLFEQILLPGGCIFLCPTLSLAGSNVMTESSTQMTITAILGGLQH